LRYFYVKHLLKYGKSGRELLPEITSAHPDVAVIMSTAVLEPKIIIDCMKLGADDYITKPFTIEDIIQSVDKAIEMKRLARRINSYQKHLEITVD
jgi:DNA-binding NtrC family response regulator